MPEASGSLKGITCIMMKPALTVTALLAATLPAAAHSGAGAMGFLHPFAGLDHVLAMVAVGMLVAQGGGWRLPGAFLLAMAAGAVAGLVGLTVPGVELAIALSVAALGLGLAFVRSSAGGAALAAVAAFGLCHGLAHGTEAAAGGGASLVVGMLVGTAVLHAAGALAGHTLRGGFALRGAGAAMVVAGLTLAFV